MSRERGRFAVPPGEIRCPPTRTERVEAEAPEYRMREKKRERWREEREERPRRDTDFPSVLFEFPLGPHVGRWKSRV